MARVKIGVFGCSLRGTYLAEIAQRHPDAEVVALCESHKPRLDLCIAEMRSIGASVTGYEDFDSFLNHDMDAVVLTNYSTEHAPFAVRVLDSGRHALSEVVACQTMAEGVALVEAVERNPKLVYSFAENYCCLRGILEMRRLYERGDIGEFLHAQGEYVHYLEKDWFRITYGDRWHWRNWVSGSFYCTHSLGPIVAITGTRPVRLTAYETPNVNRRNVGSLASDGSSMVCQMSNGGTAHILRAAFKREPDCAVWYAVFGTEGMMETDRWGEMPSRVNVCAKSNLQPQSYAPEFPVPSGMADGAVGHWGADYYPMHFFLQRILGREGGERSIDVYQAMDMSLPGILEYRSIWEGNSTVEVPDFRDKAVREQYRNDNWALDPAMAGEGQPDMSSSFGKVEVPDSVFEAQVAEYEAWLKSERAKYA